MCRRTHFDCETAEFSCGVILGDAGGPQIDNWQPAKVYVSEVTERSRAYTTFTWLLNPSLIREACRLATGNCGSKGHTGDLEGR